MLYSSTAVVARPKEIDYSKSFKDGDMIIQTGLGFGVPGNHGDSTIVPPVSVAFDWAKALGKKDLPFSFGGIIGYGRDLDKYTSLGYKTEIAYNYFLIGARIFFHFNLHKELDLYAGLMFGYTIVSTNVTTSLPAGTSVNTEGSYFTPGVVAGARYFLTDNLAIYGELGYTFGYINGGVAFKL